MTSSIHSRPQGDRAEALKRTRATTKNTGKATRARLEVENLESRLVMTTATAMNGVLSIVGTDAAERIKVSETESKVVVQGVGAWEKSEVKSIVVDAKGGNDVIDLRGVRIGATIQAGAGNDLVIGTEAIDVIHGGAGNDTLHGMGGNDILHGNAGNDVLRGGAGDDVLMGHAGNDRLFGEMGRDTLKGGGGHDHFFAAGLDRIVNIPPTRTSTTPATAKVAAANHAPAVAAVASTTGQAVVAGAVAAAATPVRSGVFRATQVLGFDHVGNPAWRASAYNRVRNSALVVGTDRRTVRLYLPDTWYGYFQAQLTPIAGKANLYSFSASRSYRTAGGLSVSYVEAVVQTNSSGKPIAMAFRVASGNTLAAVVNSVKFGTSSQNLYQGVVSLS